MSQEIKKQIGRLQLLYRKRVEKFGREDYLSRIWREEIDELEEELTQQEANNDSKSNL